MPEYLMRKNLIVLVVIVLVVGAVFLVPKKKVIPHETPPETKKTTDNQNTKPADKIPPKAIVPLTEKEKLLANLKTAGDREDYAAFAGFLATVYEKNWAGDKDFETVGSAAYVVATDKYYRTGDYAKSLEVATIVYNKAPMGWRFTYLRIVSLEKLGRAALAKGDLASAQYYALTILQMSFRLEGSNLLADVYIKKIQADLEAKNKSQALADYNYVKDFEVSADRTDKLNQLKAQIGKL